MAVIQYMAIIINNHGVGFIFFSKKLSTHHSTGKVPYGGTSPPGLESSTQQECSHFPRFIPGLNRDILSVIGDVPVDREAPVSRGSASSVYRRCS